MQKILNKLVKDIRPSEEEIASLKNKINEFLKKLNKNLKDAKAILGGSGAKGTWLKGACDADIFVRFDYKKYKDKSDQLSDLLEKHMKKSFPEYSRLHGSRDYFQVKEKDFIFEIIPILDIKKADQAKNITDVSPLHSKWVKKFSKLKDEIRLTKAFCKAQDVYGAESYINGFSGYICEILTIYYKSFSKLVKEAAKWDEKVVIDAEKYYKSKKDVLFELNKAKLQSPIIIIDPVQKDRNAAAALSYEKFELFRKKCKEFIRKPSESFFIKKEITIDSLKKKAKENKLLLLDVRPFDGKDDVIGCKLLKAYKFLLKELQAKEFLVLDSGWKWNNECFFWYIVDKKQLPATEIRIGPPDFAKEHVKIFKKKYKNVYLDKKRYYTKVKRQYRTPASLLKDLFKDYYLKDKVKSIKLR